MREKNHLGIMILTIAFLEFKVRFNSNKENFTDNEIQKEFAV